MCDASRRWTLSRLVTDHGGEDESVRSFTHARTSCTHACVERRGAYKTGVHTRGCFDTIQWYRWWG